MLNIKWDPDYDDEDPYDDGDDEESHDFYEFGDN